MRKGYITKAIERAEDRFHRFCDCVNAGKNGVVMEGRSFKIGQERTFWRSEDIAMYLNRISNLFKIYQPWPRALDGVKVKKTWLTGRPLYVRWSMTLYLPRKAPYREAEILHQFAHHLAGEKHGPPFRRAYMQLLDQEMGEQTAELAEACWRSEGLIA